MTWLAVVSLVRQRILGLPARATQLVTGRPPDEVFTILEELVRGALRELSETEIEVETS
jgi:hypothetical protein